MTVPAPAASGSAPETSARPPTDFESPAPHPDAAAPPRRTVIPRPTVEPRLWDRARPGFPTQHPYVRTFWTAAIGPGAVADLMRLAVAAQRGRSLPLPPSASLLSREGLISWSDGFLLAGPRVPPLPDHHVRRMPPPLRRKHAAAVADLRSSDRSPTLDG